MKHSTGRSSFNELATIPAFLLYYFRDSIHTGRGTGHQIATTNTVVTALAEHPILKPLVANDEICYFAGAKAGRRHRNVDLVLGPPAAGAVFDDSVGMLYGMPRKILASGEYKTIMTEHGKNSGNRTGDLRQHASLSRELYGADVVTFGVCVVNAADSYFSYTANKDRSHGDGRLATARSVDALRDTLSGSAPLHALWTPVVVVNNSPKPDLRTAEWLAAYPQPADGDELSWGHLLETVARGYRKAAA